MAVPAILYLAASPDQLTTIMDAINNDPFLSGDFGGMNTLSECLNSTAKHGYTESFIVQDDQLLAPSNGKSYPHEDVHIVNFFRFEGASNPDDMSILFVIKTTDGLKGVLVDAYGAYSDADISTFIRQVEDIQKRERK